jgi:hypothetical protein
MSLSGDLGQSFHTLEDPVSLEGRALSKVLEGDAAALKNASAGLVAKDLSGNLIYLRTNAAGKLLVTSDDPSASAGLNASAKVTPAGANVETQVLEISLAPGLEYKNIGWILSCLRQAEYRLAVIDDPTGTPVETELATWLVAPGDVNTSGQLENLSFTAPATDPVLRLYGSAKFVASDLRGTITLQEVQP